jgi:hypothetical protein
VLGGSANYFAAAASLFVPVQVVGVVGDDYPMDRMDFLVERGVDLSGIEQAAGESFFWKGRYHYDLNSRDTIWTRLGVFADFHPHIPDAFRDARIVFLGNIDPILQLDVLEQVRKPELVACDTMNYWIEGSRDALLRLLKRVQILLVNWPTSPICSRPHGGCRRVVRATSWSKRASTARFSTDPIGSSSRRDIRWKRCSIPRAREMRSRVGFWDRWPARVNRNVTPSAAPWCMDPPPARTLSSASASTASAIWSRSRSRVGCTSSAR